MAVKFIAYYAHIITEHGKPREFSVERCFHDFECMQPSECAFMVPGSLAQMQAEWALDDEVIEFDYRDRNGREWFGMETPAGYYDEHDLDWMPL